ncbi:hypothetical protein BBJ28_00005908 [Nothophytophthora sp. Chile5]|nr:hypothetical protein BBJ28_00005908 [Nothophytophthora sp. Chile5]
MFMNGSSFDEDAAPPSRGGGGRARKGAGRDDEVSDVVEVLSLDDRRTGSGAMSAHPNSLKDDDLNESVDGGGADYLSGARSSVIQQQRELQKKKLQERMGGGKHALFTWRDHSHVLSLLLESSRLTDFLLVFEGVVRTSLPKQYSAPRSLDVDEKPSYVSRLPVISQNRWYFTNNKDDCPLGFSRRFGRDDDDLDDDVGGGSSRRAGAARPTSSSRGGTGGSAYSRRSRDDNDEDDDDGRRPGRSGGSREWDRDRDRGSGSRDRERERDRGERDRGGRGDWSSSRDQDRDRDRERSRGRGRDRDDSDSDRERSRTPKGGRSGARRGKDYDETPVKSTKRGAASGSRSRSASADFSSDDERNDHAATSYDPSSPGRDGGDAASKGRSAGSGPAVRKPKLDITDIRAFLLRPIPKAYDVVECYIERNKSGANKMFPEYCLYMKEGDRFLLTAKKRPKNRTSNYLMSMQRGDLLRRGSDNYVGKLRANFLGTEFTIYDNGSSPKDADQQTITSNPAGIRQELGIAMYAANVLGHRGPRKMKVCVPRVREDGTRVVWRPLTKDDEMVNKCKEQDHTNLTYLINKPPRWNDQVCAYVLNFNGRVTMASVKNFQLVTPEDQETVVLQFGRVGKDLFTMDFRWPLCPLQAFATTLSSFDSKLACEMTLDRRSTSGFGASSRVGSGDLNATAAAWQRAKPATIQERRMMKKVAQPEHAYTGCVPYTAAEEESEAVPKVRHPPILGYKGHLRHEEDRVGTTFTQGLAIASRAVEPVLPLSRSQAQPPNRQPRGVSLRSGYGEFEDASGYGMFAAPPGSARSGNGAGGSGYGEFDGASGYGEFLDAPAGRSSVGGGFESGSDYDTFDEASGYGQFRAPPSNQTLDTQPQQRRKAEESQKRYIQVPEDVVLHAKYQQAIVRCGGEQATLRLWLVAAQTISQRHVKRTEMLQTVKRSFEKHERSGMPPCFKRR